MLQMITKWSPLSAEESDVTVSLCTTHTRGEGTHTRRRYSDPRAPLDVDVCPVEPVGPWPKIRAALAFYS